MNYKQCIRCGKGYLDQMDYHLNYDKGNYYYRVVCKHCVNLDKKKYYTSNGRKGGLPKNYTHSADTRRKISKSNMGKKHTPEMRDNLSRGQLRRFKNKYSWSLELSKNYMKNKECLEWIEANKELLDKSEDCYSNNRMDYLCAKDFYDEGEDDHRHPFDNLYVEGSTIRDVLKKTISRPGEKL